MPDDMERDHGRGYHYEGPERRQPLSERDIETLANAVAEKVSAHQSCSVFTPEEVASIKSLLKTQKNVVRITLWVMAALAIWILKDVYGWIAKNLSFIWGGK